MIEAMACGTPVIGFPRGSVPELVESGVSGFIARNVKEAAEMVKAVPALSRRRCRDYFERCFSAARMCDDYVQVYKRLLELKEGPALSTSDQVVSWTIRASPKIFTSLLNRPPLTTELAS
jgi:hypothetical protein